MQHNAVQCNLTPTFYELPYLFLKALGQRPEMGVSAVRSILHNLSRNLFNIWSKECDHLFCWPNTVQTHSATRATCSLAKFSMNFDDAIV
jgi:hypothetical protein